MATLSVPQQVPSSAEDAEQLWKACKGWGTDEETLISILTHRDATQRKQITQAYEKLFNENLIKRLESELSSHFKRALCIWTFDPVEREAILAKEALNKDFDFRVIVEIACVNSPNEILAIKQAYQSLYKSSLEEDVASHTSGDLRKFLVGLVSTYRYAGKDIDIGLANSEARILHEAIMEKAYGHEELVRILSTRSKAQLNATFNCYKDEFNTSIAKSLSKTSGDHLAYALLITIRCFIDPNKYFEKLLRRALDSSEKDEEDLSRVIVTRAEKDLKVIKEMYFKRTNVALEKTVEKETTGDLKKFLLELIGS